MTKADTLGAGGRRPKESSVSETRVKAVIVAAGYGTRFLPVTRVVPKELLPIVDRPAIDFVVDELIDAGVTDLLVITSRRKKAMLFDPSMSALPIIEKQNSQSVGLFTRQ